MSKRSRAGLILAGLAAGAVNGLFGAGGGMVLIPLLMLLTDLDSVEVFASSLAIILPLCVVSLIAGAVHSPIPWRAALPYLSGSAAGGTAAGLWGQKIPVRWLHRGLGIMILWGGIRFLC